MNALDVGLLVVAGLFGWAGWRQGLLRGGLSMAGFVGGALLAVLLVPDVLARFDVPEPVRLLLAVLAVLLAAVLGQSLLSMLGRRLHHRMTWRPARVVDAVGGAAFNLLALALVVWLVASAVSVLPDRGIAHEVRTSALLNRLDAAVPTIARDAVAGLRGVVDASGFPRVFDGLAQAPVLPVDPPDPAVLRDPAVRRAAGSLVRVEGQAPRCGETVTGSGFVYAAERVMTNAHVVAGVDAPVVRVTGTGRGLDATVVYFDPRTDVAVLDVPGLDAGALRFSGPARRGAAGVVAGFPGGGSLSVVPARVRGTIEARGQDIYGKGSVVREVYALRTEVRPGNSGGPLLDPQGSVYGVVFASSVDDAETGYALTADQVADAATAGRQATRAVDTGPCQTR